MFASSNLIAFVLTDGSAVIGGATEAADTATLVTLDTTLSTLTDDTFVTLGFKFTKGNTTDKVEFYINRKFAGVSTTNIPASTGTRVTTLDYIMGSQDRNVTYTESPA